MGTEEMMAPKAHGTSDTPVQKPPLGRRSDIADNICALNRQRRARHVLGAPTLAFCARRSRPQGPIEFYDSNTGELLFKAPIGRSCDQFVRESRVHGWPSFRDARSWTGRTRVLPNGEWHLGRGSYHLGHNWPDGSGTSLLHQPRAASSWRRGQAAQPRHGVSSSAGSQEFQWQLCPYRLSRQ